MHVWSLSQSKAHTKKISPPPNHYLNPNYLNPPFSKINAIFGEWNNGSGVNLQQRGDKHREFSVENPL